MPPPPPLPPNHSCLSWSVIAVTKLQLLVIVPPFHLEREIYFNSLNRGLGEIASPALPLPTASQGGAKQPTPCSTIAIHSLFTTLRSNRAFAVHSWSLGLKQGA